MTARRPVLLAAAAIHALFVLAPLDVLDPVDPHEIGRRLLSGDIPYEEFQFEYPPLALLAFVLPGLVPASLGVNALALQALVLQVVLAVVVLGRHDGALLRYAALSILTFPFLSGGFDIAVVVALAVATELLSRGRPGGWWVAALGAAAKLAPASVWLWARRHPVHGVLAGVVGAAIALSPAAVVGLGRESWIGWSLDRGVQAESVGASTAWLWKMLSGAETAFDYRFRAWELVGAEPAVILWLVVAGLGMVAVAWAAARSVDPWLTAYVSVMLLLVASSVLSPQFIAWPAALAAVLGGRWFWGHLAVAALTVAVFLGPSDLDQASVLIALRNAALVAVTATALLAVVKQARRRPTSAEVQEAADVPAS